MPSVGRWYALAGLIILLDQLSKWVVLKSIGFGETIYVAPFWNWVLAFNPGAAFSFLADQPGWQRWLFSALALAVSGWLAIMLRQHPQQKLLSLALALVMGGALGNVIDRIRFGRRFHSVACRRVLLACLQRRRFRHYHWCGFARD